MTDTHQYNGVLMVRLRDLSSVAQFAGKQAVLYCGLCQQHVPFGQVVAGPVPDWPYCPAHHEKPLTVEAAPIEFQDQLHTHI